MNFLWTLTVFTVLGVSGVGSDGVSVSVMEGDSVTLYTDTEANQQEKMRWYFNDIQIAAIIGVKREICTDEECEKIFGDRLKLDHQTGSLTITDTRTTDSGVYKLKVINSGSFSDKNFNVSVHDAPEQDGMKTKPVKEGESVTLDPDSGLSPGAIAGIVVAVVLLLMAAVAAVFVYRKCRARRKKQEGTKNSHDQEKHLEVLPHDQSTTPLTHEVNASNMTAHGNHVGH